MIKAKLKILLATLLCQFIPFSNTAFAYTAYNYTLVPHTISTIKFECPNFQIPSDAEDCQKTPWKYVGMIIQDTEAVPAAYFDSNDVLVPGTYNYATNSPFGAYIDEVEYNTELNQTWAGPIKDGSIASLTNNSVTIKGASQPIYDYLGTIGTQLAQNKSTMNSYNSCISALESTTAQFTSTFDQATQNNINTLIKTQLDTYNQSITQSINTTISSKLSDNDNLKSLIAGSIADAKLYTALKNRLDTLRKTQAAAVTAQGSFYIKQITIDAQNRILIYPQYKYFPDTCANVTQDYYYMDLSDAEQATTLNNILSNAYNNLQLVTVNAVQVSDSHIGNICKIISVSE